MAEGGAGRGRGGRGAIIAKLLEMERKPGTAPTPPPPSGDGPSLVETQPPTETPKPPPTGRGAMLKMLQEQQMLQMRQPQAVTAPTPETHGPVPSQASTLSDLPPVRRGLGRGQMLEMLKAQSQPGLTGVLPVHRPTPTPTPTPPVASEAAPVAERGVEGLRRQFKKIEIDEPAVSFRGSSGQRLSATSNHIPLYLKEGRGIFEYEIRFSPTVDDRIACDKMLYRQHSEIFGRHRTFDGVTMYVPQKLDESLTQLTATHPLTEEVHTISIKYRRERTMTECTHMFNLLFGNIHKELKMTRIGRSYHSTEICHMVPQHKLEIWPGYVTTVDCFEGGILLNCDSNHKVLRTQTVLDELQDCVNLGADWRDIFARRMLGQSVMTRNPVKMYRVDDIDFKQNPMSTFEYRGGLMTYVEYHNRKGIEIKDKGQPLLVHKPKPSKRPGSTGLLMLIPELCYLTGLTDEMRSDFKVMKDVAVYTRVNPNQRQLALQKLVDNIKSTPACVRLLDEWGLRVPETTVELEARTFQPETITFGQGRTASATNQADWGRAATNNPMLSIVNIDSWLIIFTNRDERSAYDFSDMMGKVSNQLGMRLNKPDMRKIMDDRGPTYKRAIEEGMTNKTQIIVIIFPTKRDDKYNMVKKVCCIERPIPSQVIISKTIRSQDKLRSVTQKIALQINCKLGGALWSVSIPFANAMICGVDSYHSKDKKKSVAGFVSSVNPNFTRWYSQVQLFSSGSRELVDSMFMLMSNALLKYYEINNKHPDTVIMFRDGLSEGELRVCKELEVSALKRAFHKIRPDYQPRVLFIVCQKRISTRIFAHSMQRRGDYDNPPPGTVVDHTITRRNYADFFLVSQMVRQGTVTPTHYVIVENTSGLDADKVQKLTFKMCHLYYNWPGTIRVPAPCQYAHKLAFLVGNSLTSEPAEILRDKLFFL